MPHSVAGMSATVTPPKNRTEPALRGLSMQLDAAGRRMQRENAAKLALGSWPWLGGLAVALVTADVIFHPGSGLRFGLGISFLCVAGAFLLAVLFVANRKRSQEHVAKILQDRAPHLGTKLLNALQLGQQARDEKVSALTRELADGAVKGYAVEFEKANLQRYGSTGATRVALKRAGLGAVGLLLLFGGAWDITRVVFPRFIDPYGDHPPFSFTRLEITEPTMDGTEVVYGQNVNISVVARGHEPSEVFISFHPPDRPDEAHSIPMFAKGDGKFSQQIEGVKTALVVRAHTKDHRSISTRRIIGVQKVPQLEKAFITTHFPEYTGKKPSETAFAFKAVRALSGSALSFRIQSNRPLKSGTIEFSAPDKSPVKFEMASVAEKEISGGFTATESGKLRFSFTDIEGISAQGEWEAPLTVLKDLSPEVRIVEPGQDGFVTEEYRLKVAFESSDDFGVKTVRFHRAINDNYGEPVVETVGDVQTNLRRTYAFALIPNLDASWNIPGLEAGVSPKPAPRLLEGEKLVKVNPGDRLSFFAEVIDSSPEPHMARSQIVTLTVISNEDYNQYLRERLDMADIAQKYTDLFNELHDLVDQQKALAETADKAKQELATAKDKEAAQKKLNELLAKQNELNQKLDKLADNMDDFVRDEPVYDLEAEFAQTLKEKAEAIRESTKANDEAGKSLAEKAEQANALSQLSDFEKAAKEQAERIGGKDAQKQEQEVAKTMEDLSELHEIIKGMNRFKELTQAQRELSEQMKPYRKTGTLTRDEQLALKEMAATQDQIRKELEAVAERLREDAKAAEESFPKAAQSARDLAQGIADIDAQRLAGKSANSMLEGKGEQSSELADRLAGEMESLFAEACENPGEGVANEADQYFQLKRGMAGGSTFKQMMQSRKFGGSVGFGKRGGQGEGEGGSGGFALSEGTQAPVMGNENAISKDSRSSSNGMSRGGQPNKQGVSALEKSDTPAIASPQNRESDTVAGESDAGQYRGLVEQYFKAITAPKK
jgi:ElaB/YqjD/DUF883 family membrane-anchored ribosome-binding protein